mmetsp:Transcript_17641/g.48971  ORF Transcript_17641/g.48971 Transcript_17641/m.48971 type:complete len:126 (+) Transcript_17641:908-1285(+)
MGRRHWMSPSKMATVRLLCTFMTSCRTNESVAAPIFGDEDKVACPTSTDTKAFDMYRCDRNELNPHNEEHMMKRTHHSWKWLWYCACYDIINLCRAGKVDMFFDTESSLQAQPYQITHTKLNRDE